jgi:hypothetical protein
MRMFALLATIILIGALNTRQVYSQHFIGLQSDEIKEIMKNSQKNFKLNTSAVNPHYNYLKYEDKINEITMLFFLSEDDRCTLVRKMCDYSNIIDVIEELNKNYKAVDKNSWEYVAGKKTYLVSLVEEEWYFTVTTRLKK